MGEVVRIEALGARVEIVAAPDTAQRLRRQWSRCAPPAAAQATGAAPAEQHDSDPDLTVDLTGSLSSEDADTVDYRVTTRVTRAAIASRAGERLLLHAAALADPGTGRAVVLVAASGTGKTTAAATLGQHLGYLTDETVTLDDAGGIEAYPKPLSTVIDPANPYAKSQHSPDDLGLLPAPPRARAALLVVLDRDPSRDGSPALDDIGLIDALLAVIPQTSALPELDRPLLRLVDLIAAVGGARRLTYAEVAGTADLLTDALSTATPVAASVEHHPPRIRPTDLYAEPVRYPARELRSDTELQRSAYVDAVQVDDEVLVLVGATPVRLTGLGATIWLACASPQQLGALRTRCLAEHGPHPDAEALVVDAAQALLSYGLLSYDPLT
ncbi:hypothetical protein VV01_01875 [Luteipulveratus halotolerans]|uniref:Uncharacterized protein n=1 Tax=Luteipulveratus halotolerans TaxID=1631356 RepID=A0A0L6CER4_9MICO|nr:hypothetical protein VV01_01875 [Luteipulveratus halotolerans]